MRMKTRANTSIEHYSTMMIAKNERRGAYLVHSMNNIDRNDRNELKKHTF